MNFTDEQQAVITSQEPTFIVTAAAGSGKTSVLSERYFRLVEGGISPDQILTITFTNKAAAEMKRRIVERLRLAGRYEDAQIAETGPIQTFHSFCERLLRENAITCGFDPGFEILSTWDSKALKVNAVREAITVYQGSQGDLERVLSALVGVHGFQSSGPYSLLEDLVEGVLEQIFAAGYATEVYEQYYGDIDRTESTFRTFIEEQLPESLRGVIMGVEPEKWQPTLHAAWKEAKKLNRAFPSAPDWVAKSPRSQSQSISDTSAVLGLAIEAASRARMEMIRRQAFDFNALEAMAIRLLEQHHAVREKVRRQFNFVMVDEAQDMSPQQDRLIELLDIENLMLVGDPQQSIYGFRGAELDLFLEKTDRLPVLRLSKNFRSEPGIIDFANDFFSTLDFPHFERMTGTQTESRAELAGFDPDDPFASPQQTFPGVEFWKVEKNSMTLATEVAKLIEGGLSTGSITILVRTGSHAEKIKSALEMAGVPAMVVGGTENYFTRLEVRDLSNILTALANPEDEYAVLASLAGFACGLSPDGLVALGSGVPVQTAIQDVALESPADQQKLEHFRRWFLPLSKRADRMSAWEVLGEVFAQSPLLSRAAQSPSGDQLVANMRKLLSMATARPELGPLAFARQIESVRDLKSREGDAPIYDDETVPVEDRPVQIMTIHKSKGLEFDCVVIAQTEKAYVRAATNFLYEMRYASAHGPKEKRLPILSVALQGTNVLMHACLRTFIKQKALLEGRRLTYVAVTRARTKLIAEMNAKARSESASKDFLEFISRSRSVTIRDLSIGDADEAEISVPSEE